MAGTKGVGAAEESDTTTGSLDEGGRSFEHIPALDGLRAVAVGLVLLFHLRVRGFAAGFVGVDVFFVISGFLITSLLLNEIHRTGRVSLRDFWARRARRLLPALSVVLVVVAVVTAYTAAYSQKGLVRGDLLATTFYVANWHFIRTTSYFANVGVESPLLHTWSLAIEEQFYLLWPLVVSALTAVVLRRRGLLLALLSAGIVVSAGLLALRWMPDATERAYMGTDSRVFEPLIGALGAVLVLDPRVRARIDRWGPWIAAVGAMGIAAAVMTIRSQTPWYYRGGALMLSAGTLFVVVAVWLRRAGPIGRVLRSAPFAWIGLISYGLYLWHWPIALWLGARATSGTGLVWRRILTAVLTLGAATVSFYLMERPIRRRLSGVRQGGEVSRRRVTATLVGVPLVLVTVACVGIAATTTPPVTPATRVVMLTGDSVPERLAVPLETALAAQGWRLVSVAHGGCSVTGELLLDPGGQPAPISTGCPGTVVAAQDALIQSAQPDVIIWWDRTSLHGFRTADGEDVIPGTERFWQLRRAMVEEAVTRMQAYGAVIVFVGTEPPGQAALPRPCDTGRCQWLQYMLDHYDDITVRWNALLKSVAEQRGDGVMFVDVASAVCREVVIRCNDTIGGETARPDGVHYGDKGAAFVVGFLLRQLAPVLARLEKVPPTP